VNIPNAFCFVSSVEPGGGIVCPELEQPPAPLSIGVCSLLQLQLREWQLEWGGEWELGTGVRTGIGGSGSGSTASKEQKENNVACRANCVHDLTWQPDSACCPLFGPVAALLILLLLLLLLQLLLLLRSCCCCVS